MLRKNPGTAEKQPPAYRPHLGANPRFLDVFRPGPNSLPLDPAAIFDNDYPLERRESLLGEPDDHAGPAEVELGLGATGQPSLSRQMVTNNNMASLQMFIEYDRIAYSPQPYP